MGALMVRKDVKRRTSLLMGILLSLLLGAAAAFFIFALPQDLLESLTTSTGLARIMVQAEPPISPNDRALLSALAGIGTAGLGWVLIDWLLFGRAGMSTLIRPREDDYEEDEGDYYRPSNPLDLVVPDSPLVSMAQPSVLDPRRPLSARTDIGDPPKSPVVESPLDTYNIASDQLLPPIGHLLPGAPVEQADGRAIFTPEPEDQPPQSVASASPEPFIKTPGPLILPTAAEIAAAAMNEPRPQPTVDTFRPPVDPLPGALAFLAPVDEVMSTLPVPAPELPSGPKWGAPIDLQPFAHPHEHPPTIGVAPPVLPLPFAAFAEPAANPVPSASREPDVAPSGAFDHAPLGDLLARLESGMQKRRPAGPPPIALESLRPAGTSRRPLPVYAAAPLQMIDPPPAPAVAQPPASDSRFGSVPSPADARDVAPLIPASQPVQQAVQPPAGQDGDGLLHQPLHVVLDVLRNRVRRPG
jgi:hypothetical protein